MKLRLDPAALEELLNAEEYTTMEFGEVVATSFRLSVASALEEISEYPNRYKKVRNGIRAKVLNPYPFSIYYEEIDHTVRVYAIAHSKRKPFYWRNRSKI
ncbi:MAG TPA: type II toxin-antitoxin system RelE/ParE family toxin [Candidatus Kapabacteria bacterium]